MCFLSTIRISKKHTPRGYQIGNSRYTPPTPSSPATITHFQGFMFYLPIIQLSAQSLHHAAKNEYMGRNSVTVSTSVATSHSLIDGRYL